MALLCLPYWISAQSDVRILSVSSQYGSVELTNIGDVAEPIGTWWLCNFPAYDQILNLPVLNDVNNDLALDPGETIIVQWDEVLNADGECGLYHTGGAFGNSSLIVDYMEWGSAFHFREGVAVSAGVWNTGEFVEGSSPFSFIGSAAEYGAGFWEGQIPGCTYPDASNFDANATVDDGSCTLADQVCLGNFNEDNLINTTDLLGFLGVFGTTCP